MLTFEIKLLISYYNIMKKLLTQKQANQIRHLHSQGAKQIELAKQFGVSKVIISQIINNKKYIEDTTPFIIGEVDWDEAQSNVYNQEYTSPFDHTDRLKRKELLARLSEIVLLDNILAMYEAKYSVKSADLKVKIVDLPANEETREWYIAALRHEQLL